MFQQLTTTELYRLHHKAHKASRDNQDLRGQDDALTQELYGLWEAVGGELHSRPWVGPWGHHSEIWSTGR